MNNQIQPNYSSCPSRESVAKPALDTWLFSLFFAMILVVVAVSGLRQFHAVGSPEPPLAKAAVPAPEMARFAAGSPSPVASLDSSDVSPFGSKTDAGAFNDEIRKSLEPKTGNAEASVGPKTLPLLRENNLNQHGWALPTENKSLSVAVSDPISLPVPEKDGPSDSSLVVEPVAEHVAERVPEHVAESLPKIITMPTDHPSSVNASAGTDDSASVASVPITISIPVAVQETSRSVSPVDSSAAVGNVSLRVTDPEATAYSNPSPAVRESGVAWSGRFAPVSLEKPVESAASLEEAVPESTTATPAAVTAAAVTTAAGNAEEVPVATSSDSAEDTLAAASVDQGDMASSENELWLVQTCSADQEDPFLCRRWNGKSWDTIPSPEFFGDQDRATVLFVHGNWTDMQVAVRDGGALWQRLSLVQNLSPGSESFRLVIWKWNSERICKRIREDCQYKAELADGYGPLFADFLEKLNGGSPSVSLVGFSFGARIIGSALNSLASSGDGSDYPVVLVSAATDYCDFYRCGRYGTGTARMTSILNVYNQTDKALRFYPLLFGKGGPDATGIGPLDPSAMVPGLVDHTRSISSCLCGSEHSFVHSLCCIPSDYLVKYCLTREKP